MKANRESKKKCSVYLFNVPIYYNSNDYYIFIHLWLVVMVTYVVVIKVTNYMTYCYKIELGIRLNKLL